MAISERPFSKLILPDVVPGYVGGVLVDEPQFKGVAVLKHPAICLNAAFHRHKNSFFDK